LTHPFQHPTSSYRHGSRARNSVRRHASPSRHTSVPLPNNSPLRHLRQQALPPAHLRIITLRLERSLRRSTGPVRRLQMMDFRHMYVHALPLCILVPHNLVNKRMLSAAEEKALLKAKYETEEQTPPPITPGRQNGYSSPRTPSTTGLFPSPMWSEPPISRDQRQISPPRSPPSLLPRPPASYIRETAEEDARLQAGKWQIVRDRCRSKWDHDGDGYSSCVCGRCRG